MNTPEEYNRKAVLCSVLAIACLAVSVGIGYYLPVSPPSQSATITFILLAVIASFYCGSNISYSKQATYKCSREEYIRSLEGQDHEFIKYD
jgi:hypothetical protein